MENWKDVVGYEGFYEVSDLGRVRRVDTVVKTAIKHNEHKQWRGRVLKLNQKRNGYLSVDLCRDGSVKTISVHKLVATAFLPHKNEQTEVNHKNCNKQDNRVCNLEWCTPRENKDHAKANGLYVNKHKVAIRCKQTQQVFESSYEAAEWVVYSVFRGSKQVKNVAAKIRSVCAGKQKSAYGFTWERA